MSTTTDSAPTIPSAPVPSNKEKTDIARSAVRRWITYAAAAFVFGVGTVMIAGLAVFGGEKGVDAAKDLFTVILPIGTGVITYWFAGRSHEKTREQT